MLLIGLTGSIAVGKSTTALMFKQAGIPLFDADAEVHALYLNEAVPLLHKVVSEAITDGQVNRAILSEKIQQTPDLLKQIEATIHPLLATKRAAFIEKAKKENHKSIVLDIPLLFETGGENKVDLIVSVITTHEIQRQRALERTNLTPAKFEFIVQKQTAQSVKKQRSHAVIDTSHGLAHAKRQVIDLIRALNL